MWGAVCGSAECLYCLCIVNLAVYYHVDVSEVMFGRKRGTWMQQWQHVCVYLLYVLYLPKMRHFSTQFFARPPDHLLYDLSGVFFIIVL